MAHTVPDHRQSQLLAVVSNNIETTSSAPMTILVSCIFLLVSGSPHSRPSDTSISRAASKLRIRVGLVSSASNAPNLVTITNFSYSELPLNNEGPEIRLLQNSAEFSARCHRVQLILRSHSASSLILSAIVRVGGCAPICNACFTIQSVSTGDLWYYFHVSH